MKEMLRQYCSIIGYFLVGLAFGFAFFYLILNINHYQELRRGAYIDVKADQSIIAFEATLDRITENIQAFSSTNYQGSMNYASATLLNQKFKNCVNLLRNEDYREIKNKTYLDIKDVYRLQQSYESKVLNECVISYFYALSDATDGSFQNDAYILENKRVLQDYMDVLLKQTSYLKKDLYDNSSYYFTTDTFSLAVKNNVKDGFYEAITAYQNVAKFIEDMSIWYKTRVLSEEEL